MGADAIDISGALDWSEDLPRPQWDLIQTLVESRYGPDPPADAWTAVARQWLAELGAALDRDYETVESEHFLILASKMDALGPPLLPFAERCRTVLLSGLAGVTDFADGKRVVLMLRTPDDYYRYIDPFYPDGEHGGSIGVHLRTGYPHVALYGKQLWSLEQTLAHELTHVSLLDLAMPQWLEEGLAQMVEHDMTGRALLVVDGEMADRHKRHWGEHGMDDFWYGDGFSRSGEVQELSYQLAEILVRLLVEEGRPRWFGWVREPQRRFFAFLRGARADDCGAGACREHLGCELRDVAARFLGTSAAPPNP